MEYLLFGFVGFSTGGRSIFIRGTSSIIRAAKDHYACSLSVAYGFHLWPQLPLGSIGLFSGPIMAAVDGLTISIKTPQIGQTHGDQADADSVDALRLTIDLYDALRPLMNRRFLSSEQPASLHFGLFQGGQRPNGIANEAQLKGTLRTISPETRKNVIQEIRKIVNQTCEPYQVEN